MPPKKTTSSTSRDVKDSGSPKKGSSSSSSPSKGGGGGGGSGGDGAGASRGWTDEEDAVFYSAMVKGYKPNWDEIMTALNKVADEHDQPHRTKKSALLHFDRYIKKPLLDKAESYKQG